MVGWLCAMPSAISWITIAGGKYNAAVNMPAPAALAFTGAGWLLKFSLRGAEQVVDHKKNRI